MLENLIKQRRQLMSEVRAKDREMWELLKKHRNTFLKYSPYTKKYYKILKLRLCEHKTLEEVGKELGHTRERVRQMEGKGILTFDGVINLAQNI